MSNKKTFSFSDRLKSFTHAFNGIKTFFQIEHNSWIHIVATLVVICLGKFFNLNKYEWCLLAIAIGIVFISEIFNTAIEVLTDIVSPEYSEKAKRVKDLAAGGVLIASITALIIGLIVFF
jgi:diacylglycerol kinase